MRGWIFKQMKDLKNVPRPRSNVYNHNNHAFWFSFRKRTEIAINMIVLGKKDITGSSFILDFQNKMSSLAMKGIYRT